MFPFRKATTQELDALDQLDPVLEEDGSELHGTLILEDPDDSPSPFLRLGIILAILAVIGLIVLVIQRRRS